ncbi:hypothetical protein Glove_41g127 [Diversispora epigaea]|uniref:Uncharacterized protein n=1 Tax=Diversispora epigaea TaxID=1348612 RepID=A0A397JF85_9GLOM|nr:hypothetical protein Glove_41g127 [Diversispora epigaea]
MSEYKNKDTNEEFLFPKSSDIDISKIDTNCDDQNNAKCFSHLSLKYSNEYNDYFTCSKICPICNKDHRKENIRDNIKSEWDDRTLPKSFNIRPGYNFKYVVSYIGNYFAFDRKRYNELFENEKLYNNLSIIEQGITPVQWAMRVRVFLQNLLNAEKFMQPKKKFHFTRFVDYLEPSDLMVNYWNRKCNKPKFQDGYVQIIQTAWRDYKQRPESLATQAWNSLKTYNYPNDKNTSIERFLYKKCIKINIHVESAEIEIFHILHSIHPNVSIPVEIKEFI